MLLGALIGDCGATYKSNVLCVAPHNTQMSATLKTPVVQSMGLAKPNSAI